MLRILFLGMFLIMVLGLPPFGLLLAGFSLPTTLTLFPIPIEPGTSSLSWPVWGILAGLIAATLMPFMWRFFHSSLITQHRSLPLHSTRFPRWGWLGILGTVSAWLLAWSRFSWFEIYQAHTFPLLWLGYIVILNAVTFQRTRNCLLIDRPRFLIRLFILSAGFWWTFEYLNQYVNNWHYVNVPETSFFEYVVFTSLSFSTVLPAVLSTYEWLNTFPRLTKPFEHWYSLQWINHPQSGWTFLALGGLGLGLIGIWPTVLFPVLWLSPLCLLAGMQQINRGKAIPCLSSLAQGDWRTIILSSGAALVCGFWWELWNSYSLVHWEYTIPYVHAVRIFEMPILGYSGYLPFGITCLAITEVVLNYPAIYFTSRIASNQPELAKIA